MLLMGIFFDFYFDLNDDTMMRDIMAGLYSGVPDGHNMQTLYPLGAALALCYRLCREIPWYGLFLFLCQFGCFFLLGLRLCGSVDDFSVSQADKTCHRYAKKGLKAAILLGLAIMMWGTWLLHMVNMQYTITCAMLCAAAVFRFMTTLRGTGAGRFVRDNIASVLLVVLAFQLRSEMLLLTLPFMAFAMWFCWWEESPFLSAKKMKKYGAVAGLRFLGMGLSLLIDSAAYGSEEWKDFRRFFDARTTVYDFYQEVVTQDEYRDALCELGVSPAKQTLLRNYNFGLDEEIDTGMLEEVERFLRTACSFIGIEPFIWTMRHTIFWCFWDMRQMQYYMLFYFWRNERLLSGSQPESSRQAGFYGGWRSLPCFLRCEAHSGCSFWCGGGTPRGSRIPSIWWNLFCSRECLSGVLREDGRDGGDSFFAVWRFCFFLFRWGTFRGLFVRRRQTRQDGRGFCATGRP